MNHVVLIEQVFIGASSSGPPNFRAKFYSESYAHTLSTYGGESSPQAALRAMADRLDLADARQRAINETDGTEDR